MTKNACTANAVLTQKNNKVDINASRCLFEAVSNELVAAELSKFAAGVDIQKLIDGVALMLLNKFEKMHSDSKAKKMALLYIRTQNEQERAECYDCNRKISQPVYRAYMKVNNIVYGEPSTIPTEDEICEALYFGAKTVISKHVRKTPKGMDRDDLIQETVIGALPKIEHFRHGGKFKLTQFAYIACYNSMMDILRKHSARHKTANDDYMDGFGVKDACASYFMNPTKQYFQTLLNAVNRLNQKHETIDFMDVRESCQIEKLTDCMDENGDIINGNVSAEPD